PSVTRSSFSASPSIGLLEVRREWARPVDAVRLPGGQTGHRRGRGGEVVTASGTTTLVERMARFAAHASYDDLSEAAREQLKIRVLDALACAISALDAKP